MIKDPQEAPVVCLCDQCQGEIYSLDLVRVVGGLTMHDECVRDYINETFPTILAEELGG